ncbi:MAG: efflux RND transporter periplasmic adaptor subunit [Arenicellales bacterium]
MTLRWVCGVCLLVAFGVALAGDGTATVRSSVLATRLSAYARVVAPTTPLRAPATGVVSGVQALPGDQVHKGATLAHLSGPEFDALLTQRDAAVRAAQAAVSAAERTLAVEQQKRSEHLSTRLTVHKAQADLSQARARLDTARAELQSARAAATLIAPFDATVLSVDATNGERVDAGQSVLTLQGLGPPWLRATFYGTSAGMVRAGMTGEFSPADGGPPISVKVRGIVQSLQPDGGETVTLISTVPDPAWRGGEVGTVTLEGAKQEVTTAPTDALILDQGQWWVLVREGGGERRQRVVPGPRYGDRTIIERGLDEGERVIVADAYLRFHHDFAAQYAQPD